MNTDKNQAVFAFSLSAFRISLFRYWLAMNASAFDAAAHAGAAFLGVAGAHAASEAIPALDLRQLAAVFAVAFGRALLAYLDAHPVEGLLSQRSEAGDQTPDASHSSSSSPMINGGGHQSAATTAMSAPQPSTLDPQP